MQTALKIPVFLSERTPNGMLPQDLPGLQHPWLLHKRNVALKRFLKNGLPTQHDEDWRHTNLAPFEAAAMQRATNNAPTQKQLNMSETACGRAVFVNGILDTDLSELDNLPKGLSVTSMRQKLEDKNAVLHDFFPEVKGSDTWHDLNMALFDDGAFIEVEAGAIIQQPLEVICLATPQQDATAYHARNIINVGAGASLKIYKSKAANAVTTNFATHMTHIILEKDATLERIVMSQHAPKGIAFTHDDVVLHEGAVFKKTAINLGGKITRQKTTICVDGVNAFASVGGLSYATGDGTTDVMIDMRHNAPHTQSKQLVRSLATDKARAIFQGKITVAQAAQKTDAAQNHQGMLLSDTAEIDAKPSLEIHADDVKCSHGNTCGALDETSLFYLRSRGIPRVEAEQLLQQAFIAELFEECDETLKETLMTRIGSAMNAGTPHDR